MGPICKPDLAAVSSIANWRSKRRFAKPLNMPFDRVAFGRRLKQARELRGLSQADLGNLLGGQTSSAVTQWETGTSTPRTSNVMELPTLLNVSAVWLFYGLGLPEQHGNGTLNPRLRGLGGHRVPKINAAAAAADFPQAVATATEFVSSPHADFEAGDAILERWDDRNATEYKPGDEVYLRQSLEPRPGDFAFVAIGPEDKEDFGQLGYAPNGNWLLHRKNPLWGARELNPAIDHIVAICLRHIRLVRSA